MGQYFPYEIKTYKHTYLLTHTSKKTNVIAEKIRYIFCNQLFWISSLQFLACMNQNLGFFFFRKEIFTF